MNQNSIALIIALMTICSQSFAAEQPIVAEIISTVGNVVKKAKVTNKPKSSCLGFLSCCKKKPVKKKDNTESIELEVDSGNSLLESVKNVEAFRNEEIKSDVELPQRKSTSKKPISAYDVNSRRVIERRDSISSIDDSMLVGRRNK